MEHVPWPEVPPLGQIVGRGLCHAKQEGQIKRSALPVEQIPVSVRYCSAAAMLHTPLWAFPPQTQAALLGQPFFLHKSRRLPTA